MGVYCGCFYELLGIDKQATTKEIRKAFKKHALTMHPDKNMGDEEAHDKFLELNKAYEVLKNDETRKIYDRYGEEGLKEKPPSGGGYHSWNYYNQEFGIYDDDPEIITLSHSDFDMSVEDTDDIWFINFYSPHCSHCHEIAPAWREMARELEGVVRVGAVNCEDDFFVCRQQGIRSYPSLFIYPAREKYSGDRTKEKMVAYILTKVRSKVIQLTEYNLLQSTQHPSNHLPWLIRFCFLHSAECIEHSNLLKIAAMLNELVNVASIDCASLEGVCGVVVDKEGLYYFPANRVEKGEGKAIESYDAREISQQVLEQLADVAMLDVVEMEKAIESGEPWLIHFVDGPTKDLDLRKLPSLVEEIKVGRVDCRSVDGKCKSLLHINKLPSFVLFKQNGDHEYHYGRQTSQDVAAFSKEALSNFVTSLHPHNFPSLSQFTIIDFFAPWCPPCMRLLPEFRKASKLMGGQVRFATVDCTTQQSLCHQHNVQSYPTTIFFNDSKPHNYNGHHSAQEIITFIEDVIKPPVFSLDGDTFKSLVEQRGPNDIWLVDFFAPWCGPCQQLAPEWRRLAKMFKEVSNVNVGQVDCQQHQHVCKAANVNSYPTIRIYVKSTFHAHSGWQRDADSLRAWTFSYLPSKAYTLDPQLFDSKVISSNKPWVIDFYATWCGHCQDFAPVFEQIAIKFKGAVRAGKVNCGDHRHFCERAGVSGFPTVLYYPAYSDTYKGIEIDSQDGDVISNFINDKLAQQDTGKTRIEL